MDIHITTHSAYSLQEGLALPADLAQAAAAAGMPMPGLVLQAGRSTNRDLA